MLIESLLQDFGKGVGCECDLAVCSPQLRVLLGESGGLLSTIMYFFVFVLSVLSLSFFLGDKGGGFHAPWIPGNKLEIWCRSAFIVVVSEIVMIRDSAP